VGTLRETADKLLTGRLDAGRLSEEGHQADAEKLYWGKVGDSVASPWTRKPIPAVSKANLADVVFEEGVLVQPEMEKQRFPLVDSSPSERIFKGMGVYRPMSSCGCNATAREDILPRC
jgi:hypothetical protein